MCKLLEDNTAFKEKWQQMLDEGGDDSKKFFAPLGERAAKRARAAPYGY